MWKCVSDQQLKKYLLSTLFFVAMLAVVFYTLQNTSVLPGGKIAFPKLLWLSLVIFCWFLLPALLLLDQCLKVIRKSIQFFLLNMLLRGSVELTMMYVTNNWHPYYGIAHDIFSILLSSVLAFQLRNKSPLVAVYLGIMAILFIFETMFAWYMLNNVQNDSGIVYYVPEGNSHQMILHVTSVVVALTTIYLLVFIRKWLYGTSLKC